MVNGFDSFREKFKGYEDCYTIIGGTACDILMNEAGLGFRATKDIDMILLIEERFAEFAAAFWSYIKDGGYKCGWKNSDVPHFYRFTEPQTPGYPAMIELFSRRPDFQIDHPEIHLTPLPVSDELSSLSAIMLDDNYYRLMLARRKTVDGVSVLGAEYLMLFKIKAWLDLREKKADGAHVNERDLKKHKPCVDEKDTSKKRRNKIIQCGRKDRVATSKARKSLIFQSDLPFQKFYAPEMQKPPFADGVNSLSTAPRATGKVRPLWGICISRHCYICFVCLWLFGSNGNSFRYAFRLYLLYQRREGEREWQPRANTLISR